MIEEVVNSILQAEDVAAQRVAEAERKANEIIAEADIAAERNKKQALEEHKQKYVEQMTQAQVVADGKAAEELATLNAATDGEIEKCKANVDQAVKIILENLL